jgi:hypothetical protein
MAEQTLAGDGKTCELYTFRDVDLNMLDTQLFEYYLHIRLLGHASPAVSRNLKARPWSAARDASDLRR